MIEIISTCHTIWLCGVDVTFGEIDAEVKLTFKNEIDTGRGSHTIFKRKTIKNKMSIKYAINQMINKIKQNNIYKTYDKCFSDDYKPPHKKNRPLSGVNKNHNKFARMTKDDFVKLVGEPKSCLYEFIPPDDETYQTIKRGIAIYSTPFIELKEEDKQDIHIEVNKQRDLMKEDKKLQTCDEQ